MSAPHFLWNGIKMPLMESGSIEERQTLWKGKKKRRMRSGLFSSKAAKVCELFAYIFLFCTYRKWLYQNFLICKFFFYHTKIFWDAKRLSVWITSHCIMQSRLKRTYTSNSDMELFFNVVDFYEERSAGSLMGVPSSWVNINNSQCYWPKKNNWWKNDQ